MSIDPAPYVPNTKWIAVSATFRCIDWCVLTNSKDYLQYAWNINWLCEHTILSKLNSEELLDIISSKINSDKDVYYILTNICNKCLGISHISECNNVINHLNTSDGSST